MKKIPHQNEDTVRTKEIKLNQVILVNVKHQIVLTVQMVFLPLIFDIFFYLSLFLLFYLVNYVILRIF